MSKTKRPRGASRSETQSAGQGNEPQPNEIEQSGNVELDRELLRSLMRELYQAEESARSHPRVEAERHPGSPPAHAMEAVSRHAAAVEEDLIAQAKAHALPVSGAGMAVGRAFSVIRRGIVDSFMDSETSYRATLLGMRHGLDVMKVMREVATAAHEEELAEWCDRVFEARLPLVEECANQLAWFARHPDQAVAPAGTNIVARGVGVLRTQLARLQSRSTPSTSASPTA